MRKLDQHRLVQDDTPDPDYIDGGFGQTAGLASESPSKRLKQKARKSDSVPPSDFSQEIEQNQGWQMPSQAKGLSNQEVRPSRGGK